MIFVYTVLLLVLLELALILAVNSQRSKFQWLITSRDELPDFDQEALEKFLNTSFDKRLGWVRKPDTSGIEQGQNGIINFQIDSIGSRTNRYSSAAPIVAAFGDSYTFCRQVEDDETWESRMAEAGKFGVLNYGVGNYGIDQALLRYEDMTLPGSVKIVIMGFVPETICRIQSYWKHYLEFGNTFAFKPRFILEASGDLKLVENRMRNLEGYFKLQEYLPEIRRMDRFYDCKFRSLQYRFPYLLSLLRNPMKQTTLLLSLALRGLSRMFRISGRWSENLPFVQLMKANINDAQNLYHDDASRKLLAAICTRFKMVAEARGHLPLLLVMPQLLDLRITRKGDFARYQPFFTEMTKQMAVLDLTSIFAETDYESLYINDQYGGHLSESGNRLVAEKIMLWLTRNGAIR